jgi:DNA-binding response OmpR family regulator
MPEGACFDGRRILIVEDQYLLAADIARALRQAGAQVAGPAPDLIRGLALTRAEPIDAAVLDINLDGEDVYPLAEELVQSGVPIVFATGVDGAILPSTFRDTARLDKPIRIPDLIRILARLLDGGRPPTP